MSEKNYFRIIGFFSAAVFAVVAGLYMLPKAKEIPVFVQQMPRMNAVINGTCSVLLICSFLAIRRKKVQTHRTLNLIAFMLSGLFLASYIVFHSYGVETKYPAENPLRPMYLVILFTHILLAAIVLPLVLVSFYRGLQGDVERHRKIVRWSFPVWLYVTVTGVIVYLMISPYYKF